MARLLAEAQGGTLSYGTAENGGTVFALKLPRVVTATESLPSPSR